MTFLFLKNIYLRRRPAYCLLVLFALPLVLLSQTATISGTVTADDGTGCPEFALIAIRETGASAEPDGQGRFSLKEIAYGSYTLVALALGKQTQERQVTVNSPRLEVHFLLENLAEVVLNEVVVLQEQETALGIRRLSSIQDFTVYEGKKNEVVLLQNLAANTAANNARQIYAAVTGLNIWESDGAGLQLGIGGRGLSPNRTSNFNTRQNGYDISADALGYPESYYTPPAEALDRIEVIRGAAGLQYGTQFGGVVNFRLKKGSRDVPIGYTGRQSVGSWGLLNSFNSIGGSSADQRWNYYAFYQRKQGDGWRPNSQFEVNTAYLQASRKLSKSTDANLEFTHTDYLAKQPGGLTDALFAADARQSVRSRNWFRVQWNLAALTLTHRFSLRTHLNLRTFGLLAGRQALGNLERINVVDFNQNRTMIDGSFRNLGSELRLVHRYFIGKKEQQLLAGARGYTGRTAARQGDANAESGPDFSFLNPGYVEGSDYVFPNRNLSLFVEHIFKINEKWSLTPGIRFEWIRTRSEGYYRQRVFDFAGNVIVDRRIDETLGRTRALAIAGLGLSWKWKPVAELYANFSQNYRAINFSDLRIQNPNFAVDTALTDERGYTADLGIRGSREGAFSYELTAFYLHYNNRIGQVLRADQPPLYLDYRLRTNVAASRSIGLEGFASLNFAHYLCRWLPKGDLTGYLNASLLHTRYTRSKDSSIEGREVEMAPPYILRSGINWKSWRWKAGVQISHVARHFSDATNAERTSTAVEGIIPAYTVADLTLGRRLTNWLSVEASCNNLLDERYFTRRAEAYPGPGIIPSDGRSFFLTVEVKWR